MATGGGFQRATDPVAGIGPQGDLYLNTLGSLDNAFGQSAVVVSRSVDGGATWTEAKAPPAFPKGDPHGRSVDHSFWLEPGHASEPGVWWVGTSPPGLFRSADGGDTWAAISDHLPVMVEFDA